MSTLFRACIRLLPEGFRTQFGQEILDEALRDYALSRARGRLAALWTVVALLANIVWSALAERVQPGTPAPSTPSTVLFKGFDMRHVLNQWSLDVRYAVRSLRRSPGFSAIATLTLALAIGVTAGIFSVVNTVLIQPLPFGQPDRLVFIGGTAPGSDLPPSIGTSAELYLQYRDRARTIEDVSLFNSFTNTLRVGDRVERIRMSGPTYTLFSTLGAVPVLGRLPTAADESRTAVISYRLWQTWFDGSPDVVGQTHYMGNGPREIVGVMGPDFRFPTDDTLLWLSGNIQEAGLTPGRLGFLMVARMAPGATMDSVARELTGLARDAPARFGGSNAYAEAMGRYQAVVRGLADQLLGAAARPLWVLLGAGLVVLLIACANVANLFLVRGEGRHREMAVRQAIGAQRGQLLRVQMAEVLVIAIAAGTVAMVLARMSLPVFVRMAAPAGVLRLEDARIDAVTMVATAVLALLAGLACGLFPALRGARPSLSRLRDGSRTVAGGRLWARNTLVVAQTALALVLLIGSGLLLRSYTALSRVDPGYDTRDIFTFQIAPAQPSLTDGPSYARFIMNFADRLQTLPGVESVGVIENVPLDEGTATARFKVEGDTGQGTLLGLTYAGGDYYKTMGIEVLAGRPFTREDATTNLGNAIVSRSAARMLWPDADPVGRRIQRVGLDTWETVVGVVEDVVQNDLREPGSPLVYLPLTGQQPQQWGLSSPAYVVKTARADSIAPDIRSLVREIAPEAPMYRMYTLDGLVARSVSALSFTMLTLGLVSMLALILGAVGLYGVLSYVVTERTREIGVRMALGAQVGGVRRMVVAQGARVVGVGVLIGLAVALTSTRVLGSMLYGVEAFDASTFIVTSVGMTLIGLAASYVPARRASNVDPIRSLRGE